METHDADEDGRAQEASAVSRPGPLLPPPFRPPFRPLALALLLLALPAALLAPSLLPDRRLLPHLPVGLAPLASEHPEAAAEVWERANWSTSDRVFPALTDQLAMRAALRSGHLPTWEPRLGLGVPLFAGSMAGGAYPPNWLGHLVGPGRAAGWLAVLSLGLAGLGAYLFLGRRGLDPRACALGALAFQAGGWGAANLEYFMKVDAALWLPWHLWAVEGLVRGRPRAGPCLALSTGLSFLAGFPPIAVFGLAAAGVWALVRALGFAEPLAAVPFPAARSAGAPRVPALARALAWVVVGVAAAGVQLLPTAEASRTSLRRGADAERLAEGTLPPASALALAVPGLFGSPLDRPGVDPAAAWVDPDGERALRANPLEWNTFAGVAALALALAALVATPRAALAPALLLLGVHAYAWGVPPASWLYRVPGLDLGAPNRALALGWFLWPWLAALGAEALLADRPRARRAVALAAALLVVGAAVAPALADGPALQGALETTLAARHELPVEDVRQAVGAEAGERLAARARHAGRVWLGTALGLGAALVLLRRGRRARAPESVPRALGALALVSGLVLLPSASFLREDVGPHALGGAAVGAALLGGAATALGSALGPALPLAAVLLAEGVGTGAPHVVPQDTGGLALFPSSDTLDAVAEAAGDGRVVRLDPTLPAGEEVLALARPNLLQPYDVLDLGAFVIFTPRTLADLATAMHPATLHGAQLAGLPDAALLDHPLLDRLRVTAVLSAQPLEHPRLEEVLSRPGFHVHRRTGVPPAARVVGEVVRAEGEAAVGLLAAGAVPEDAVVLGPGAPGLPPREGAFEPGEVRTARPAPNRFDVQVTGSSGGWLVLREQYLPGWKATVDGEDAPIVRADHAFRAVRVPPGDSLVRTWYEPWSLRFGALATLVALALVVRGLLRRPRTTEYPA